LTSGKATPSPGSSTIMTAPPDGVEEPLSPEAINDILCAHSVAAAPAVTTVCGVSRLSSVRRSAAALAAALPDPGVRSSGTPSLVAAEVAVTRLASSPSPASTTAGARRYSDLLVASASSAAPLPVTTVVLSAGKAVRGGG